MRRDLQELLDFLEPDKISLQGRVEKAFWDVVNQYYLDEQARRECAPGPITESTAHEHGMPEPQLVAAAWEYLNSPEAAGSEKEAEPTTFIRSESMIHHIQRLLERIGFTEWRVVPVPKAPAPFTYLSQPDKQIKVRVGDEIPRSDVKKILANIAVTRLGRAENGERNEERLPSLMSDGFWGYMPAEFGLSRCLAGHVDGQPDAKRLREDAASYIAADICLSGSFFDAFSTIREFIDEEKALEIVTRLKRGIADTAQPGCFLYSIVYWKGYHEAKAHLQTNPEDLDILYTGKIGLANIPFIRELLDAGIIEMPSFRPAGMLDMVNKIGDDLVGR